MDKVRLGRTGITVNKNGFGALPIQRAGKEEAARYSEKRMITESACLTRRGHILTARKRFITLFQT